MGTLLQFIGQVAGTDPVSFNPTCDLGQVQSCLFQGQPLYRESVNETHAEEVVGPHPSRGPLFALVRGRSDQYSSS